MLFLKTPSKYCTFLWQRTFHVSVTFLNVFCIVSVDWSETPKISLIVLEWGQNWLKIGRQRSPILFSCHARGSVINMSALNLPMLLLVNWSIRVNCWRGKPHILVNTTRRCVFTAINFIERSRPLRFWKCGRSIQGEALRANLKAEDAIFKHTNKDMHLYSNSNNAMRYSNINQKI